MVLGLVRFKRMSTTFNTILRQRSGTKISHSPHVNIMSSTYTYPDTLPSPFRGQTDIVIVANIEFPHNTRYIKIFGLYTSGITGIDVIGFIQQYGRPTGRYIRMIGTSEPLIFPIFDDRAKITLFVNEPDIMMNPYEWQDKNTTIGIQYEIVELKDISFHIINDKVQGRIIKDLPPPTLPISTTYTITTPLRYSNKPDAITWSKLCGINKMESYGGFRDFIQDVKDAGNNLSSKHSIPSGGVQFHSPVLPTCVRCEISIDNQTTWVNIEDLLDGPTVLPLKYYHHRIVSAEPLVINDATLEAHVNSKDSTYKLLFQIVKEMNPYIPEYLNNPYVNDFHVFRILVEHTVV